MVERSANPFRKWEPITDAHEDVIETYREAYEALKENQRPDPLAIVGAYGSGKTQLMYQIFNECWKNDIGAVYIGDPGKLLAEFDEASHSDIATWLAERIPEEIDSYVEGGPDDVKWFPNTEPEKKSEWLDENINVNDAADISKYALLVDEVEQHYEDFLAAIETDDDNPLRRINDELENTLKVWSFGMLSAYEFLGEADWRRLEELRVPPIDVGEVADRIQARENIPAELANIIWWMGRGRTGLIIKLIEELPSNVTENVPGWIDSMADTDPQEIPVIDDIWTDLPANEWDDACRALAFQRDYSGWLLEGNEAYSAETMTNIVSDVIFEYTEFPDTREGSRAKRIIKRNVARVFDGVTPPNEQYFPYQELMFEEEEVLGLLSLVEDQILTFEPKGTARQRAIDAIDLTPGDFSSEFYNVEQSYEESPVEGEFTTLKFSVLDDAFPPIALNPDLVADTPTKELREELETSLEFRADTNGTRMRVFFCPTKVVFERQLRLIQNEYDITSPSVVVAPEELVSGTHENYQTLQQHQLLIISPHESTMLWDFVINLKGALEEQGLDPNLPVDESLRRELLETVDTRDARNTIDTLFDQLRRVANEEATQAEETYVARYSLPGENTVLWEKDRLESDGWFWSTTGEYAEIPPTNAFLLLLSDNPDFNQPYGRIHSAVSSALDKDLISGGTNFPYTEFFKNLYGKTGFTGRLTNERDHYFENNQLADGANNTQLALYQVAEEYDPQQTVETLIDREEEARHGDIAVLDNELSEEALSLLRALLLSKFAIADDSPLALQDELEAVKADLDGHKSTIDRIIEDIEMYEEMLSAPECANVGTWPHIDYQLYLNFQDVLETVVQGIDNLQEQIDLTPGLAPYGCAYLLILDQFSSRVSKKIDEHETTINSVDMSNIELLKESYTDLYQTVEDTDAIERQFDSGDSFLGRLEQSGEVVFDFDIGMNQIHLPSNYDRLVHINSKADDRVERLERLRELVDKLEHTQSKVDSTYSDLELELKELLEYAVETMEGAA